MDCQNSVFLGKWGLQNTELKFSSSLHPSIKTCQLQLGRLLQYTRELSQAAIGKFLLPKMEHVNLNFMLPYLQNQGRVFPPTREALIETNSNNHQGL